LTGPAWDKQSAMAFLAQVYRIESAQTLVLPMMMLGLAHNLTYTVSASPNKIKIIEGSSSRQ